MQIEEYLHQKYYYCGRGSFVCREELAKELLISEEEAKALYQGIIGVTFYPELIHFERLVLCVEAQLAFDDF